MILYNEQMKLNKEEFEETTNDYKDIINIYITSTSQLIEYLKQMTVLKYSDGTEMPDKYKVKYKKQTNADL